MQYKIPTQKVDFFKWKEYRDAGLIVAGGITIINGGRNIGKTTGTFIEQLRECTPDEMMFYIRNTLKEIDSYRKTFNNNFSTEFLMTQTEIWRLERVELINKKTKQIEVDYRKKEVIGYVASLNGTDGWRSANFGKIKYIFSDEYNQIGNSLNTEKFITLWTSILRTKSDVYTVIIGNRDDASADLIVELGINILIPDGHQGDYVLHLLPDDEIFKNKAYFIDLDDNRYNNNQEHTIWKAIGRATDVMGQYYDRGYKSYENIDCKKLSNNVLEKVEWEFSYTNEFDLVVGKLDGLVIVHWDREKKIKPKLRFASIPQCAKNKGYTPIEHNMEYVFYYLTTAMKEENILYTSILAKEDINAFIDEISYELDDDETKFYI